MPGRYAKGMRPSPAQHIGLGHPHYLVMVAPPPTSTTCAILAPVVNQLGLGACTGNAVGVGLCTEMSRGAGLPAGQFVELPSRLWLYFHARVREGTFGQDVGATLYDVFEGARLLGFPPESAWSYPPDDASDEELLEKCVSVPDPLAVHRAADQRIVRGAYRLQSSGQALSDDIARAIVAGDVVVWGTELDEAFEELSGSDVWPGVRGVTIGGHAMFFRAIRPSRRFPGKREFGSQSSWGEDFADGGTAWVDQDAATDLEHASEYWVISTIDTYSGGA